MNSDKTRLRQAALSARQAIAKDEHEARSFAICQKLVEVLSALSPAQRRIALYNPIREEADITPVLHALDAENIVTALPVVVSGQPYLSFYRFHSTLPLHEGAYGILEPQQAEEIIPDIVIVPLVAFDRSGQRLGYGKGYYDATLAHLRSLNASLLAIGVAFTVQEIATIPAEAHDIPLDLIITEQDVLRPHQD